MMKKRCDWTPSVIGSRQPATAWRASSAKARRVAAGGQAGRVACGGGEGGGGGGGEGEGEGGGEGGPAEALRRTCGDAAGAAEAVLEQLEHRVLPEGVLAQSAVCHTHTVDGHVGSQGAARTQYVEGWAPAWGRRRRARRLRAEAPQEGAAAASASAATRRGRSSRPAAPSKAERASGAAGGRVGRLRASPLAMPGRRSTASEVEAPALHLLPLSAAAET